MADQHESNDRYVKILVTGTDGRTREVIFEAAHDGTMTIGEALEHVPGYRRINPPLSDEESVVTGEQFMALPETPPHLNIPAVDTHAACPWCGNPITLRKG